MAAKILPQGLVQRAGDFAKLGMQLYAVWTVTDGFRIRRSSTPPISQNRLLDAGISVRRIVNQINLLKH